MMAHKLPKPTKRIPETEWAYLAGFIDGEGCISCTTFKTHIRPRVKITQREHRVLEDLHDLFEVGNLTTFSRPGKWASNNGGMIWNITAHNEVLWVLRHVRPHLKLKHRQALVALRLLALDIHDEQRVKLSNKLRQLKEPTCQEI